VASKVLPTAFQAAFPLAEKFHQRQQGRFAGDDLGVINAQLSEQLTAALPFRFQEALPLLRMARRAQVYPTLLSCLQVHEADNPTGC